MPFPSLLRRQKPGLKHSFSCLSILAKANMLKQLKLCFPGLLPAPCEKHLQGLKPSEKSFRRPTCHAYDYAALSLPTAVCICIGMHAVKRRNRTHEIHNLHKTHRPRSLQNALSVAPAQAGARLKHSFSCLSILAKANMLKQLKLLKPKLLEAQRSEAKRVSDGLRAMRTITLR